MLDEMFVSSIRHIKGSPGVLAGLTWAVVFSILLIVKGFQWGHWEALNFLAVFLVFPAIGAMLVATFGSMLTRVALPSAIGLGILLTPVVAFLCVLCFAAIGSLSALIASEAPVSGDFGILGAWLFAAYMGAAINTMPPVGFLTLPCGCFTVLWIRRSLGRVSMHDDR